ncbi:MAG: hypothetical protein HY370_07255 [Proteobacteria bacterium]|nr:hypothetical protein [Pseudomonadota bacterium]
MNRNLLIAIVVAAIVALVGGYMYAEKQRGKNSITLSIGDKKISAMVD